MKNSIKNQIKNNKLYLLSFLLVFLASLSLSLYFFSNKINQLEIIDKSSTARNLSPTPHNPPPIPSRKILSNGEYHIFQSFNNCGPAALSMALRFYGINASQKELGKDLRPYQIPSGVNDDKSVTLEEIANKSRDYDLIPYLRPMGNNEIVKQFIANDIPVITRTWLTPDDDIGHYRIIKGFDNSRGVFIQDDSLQGKDLEYSYDDFDEIWKKFNYEYLILVPIDKEDAIRQIIGQNVDENMAWEKAAENSRKQLFRNPNDIDSRFNLSVAYYKLGNYKQSVEEFEKIENRLSSRTLWYQIDPILSYYELENYQKVFEITDKILNNQNRAFSELYIIRGKIFQKQGKYESAKIEFEKAALYNSNLKEAQDLLKLQNDIINL